MDISRSASESLTTRAASKGRGSRGPELLHQVQRANLRIGLHDVADVKPYLAPPQVTPMWKGFPYAADKTRDNSSIGILSSGV